ncbi:HPr family phosphocarrier protein [Sedimentisphaera salicampi]|nr:hypothetical protein [Sedimentisphaera salicampi]
MNCMTAQYVDETKFRGLVRQRSRILYSYTSFLANHEDPYRVLTRPLAGIILSQSIQLEELVDFYGAQNNRRWARFRSFVATLKRFSDVLYELIHIKYSIPEYRIEEESQQFEQDTDDAISYIKNIVHNAANQFVEHCIRLEIDSKPIEILEDEIDEHILEGKLKYDHERRHVVEVGKIVTFLGTSFLNMIADTSLKAIVEGDKPFDNESYSISPISEEKLRMLEHNFHNMQCNYDTYVSKTDTESHDESLPVLRGHVSVVFHLLTIAVSLSHYYERHLSEYRDPTQEFKGQLVDPSGLLEKLSDYCIHYIRNYVNSAKNLCQNMIKKYSEQGEITVPVPRYRGFHVRPSTLIALIANHYGSDLKMDMLGEEYDARSPLELFRANEAINSEKRKGLNREVLNLDINRKVDSNTDMRIIVNDLVMTLADQGKMMIYDHPLEISPDINERKEATLIDTIRDEVARLLAVGKVDIVTDLQAHFRGDKRVLEDIKLLAHYGYGEDNHGNNIPLPPSLEYLRK